MKAAMLELSCLDILRYINDALGFCIDVVGVALLRCIFALYACTAVLHCAFAWENFKIGRRLTESKSVQNLPLPMPKSDIATFRVHNSTFG